MEVKDYLKAGITSFGAMQLLEEAKLKAFYAGLSPKPDAMLVEYAKGYSDGVNMKREMEKPIFQIAEYGFPPVAEYGFPPEVREAIYKRMAELGSAAREARRKRGSSW
jgi:hypothetical protein